MAAKKPKQVVEGTVVESKPERKKAPASTTKALVIQEVRLTTHQQEIVTAITPAIFIKERPVRGGKKAKYIEGGYVIAQLNKAFSPIGWDFDIVEQGILDKEVWVKGKLVIKDYKTGYSFSKTQYGQHAREDKIPLGDTLKAAGTDALKKCASMLGIGLDVYWQQMDTASEAPAEKSKPNPQEVFERAKRMIEATSDASGLIEYDSKLADSKTFNAEQKKQLHGIISRRVDELDNKK